MGVVPAPITIVGIVGVAVLAGVGSDRTFGLSGPTRRSGSMAPAVPTPSSSGGTASDRADCGV